MKYVKEHKQAIILVALAVFIVAEIIVVAVREFGGEPTMQDGVVPSGDTLVDEADEVGVPEFTTDVPKDAVETKPSVDVPIESDPEGKQRLGVYPITVTKDGYSPSILVVIQGDIVNLELTSQGGMYDIYSPAFGFYLSAPDGVTTQISFGAPVVGTFPLECRDYCPKGEKIYGQLVVKPRE